MDEKQATHRFFWGLFPAMGVFLAASIGIAALHKTGEPSQSLLVGLSLIPICAQIISFWAYWRFVNEVDEFLRAIQIKAVLFGLVVILTIATSWGYLEAYADAPDMKLIWLNPLFCLGYGIGAFYFTKRDGGDFR